MRLAVAMPGGLATRFEDFEENRKRHLIPDWVGDHGEVVSVLVRYLECLKVCDAPGDDRGKL
jgi:hypothetical protein